MGAPLRGLWGDCPPRPPSQVRAKLIACWRRASAPGTGARVGNGVGTPPPLTTARAGAGPVAAGEDGAALEARSPPASSQGYSAITAAVAPTRPTTTTTKMPTIRRTTFTAHHLATPLPADG